MFNLRILAAVALCASSASAFADNVLHPATPVLDRPTQMALGVKLPLTGDDNYNASVSVRYRTAASTVWRDALPLYRVRVNTVFGYTVAPQFSGSIVDLRPNTTYTIELHAVDPDGSVNQTFTLTGTTRAVPGNPATARVVPVATAAQLQTALAAALPGDIISLAAGTYPGLFLISNSGTAANPIVIRGADQDTVILDGQNCTCRLFSIAGNYTYLENLTLRNADLGVRIQTGGAQGNVVRRVHIQNTRLGITSNANQLDLYIADNILEGRLRWPLIYTDDGGAHSDDDGISVQGFGVVVAHNRISGYGDAMKNDQWGTRAVDFYGNDVLWSYDNGIELDGIEANGRAMRNRLTNVSTPLSVQPIFAGPAYILRNVVVNIVDEQIKFHALNISRPPPQPNGVFIYNNTFVSSVTELQVQTPYGGYHSTLENNLFLGPSPLPGRAVNWDSPLHNVIFDYNGYFPDGRFLFRWETGYGNYPNFAALQAAGVERNGMLLAGQTFASGLTAPTNYRTLIPPPDVTLSATTPALNRALLLPNINDAFTGSAPDLGALERGCALPIYGPRPAGTDESNEPVGCEAVTPPATTDSAVFVKMDTSTLGNWKSAYGSEGAIVAGDGATYPTYGTVTPAGNSTVIWQASTPDIRALLKRAPATDRVAAAWYSPTGFTIDLNFTDGKTHQVALFGLDMNSVYPRSERIDIVDPAGTVLDTRPLSSFFAGRYLVWNISGRVTIRITNTNPLSTAAISGLFFGM